MRVCILDERQRNTALDTSRPSLVAYRRCMLLSLGRKYKSHYIHPNADQHPETKMWTVRVLISWEGDGKPHYRTLYGSPDQFDNLPDAIKFGIEYAMNWIDRAESQQKGSV